jgi:hypothetical protein
MARIECPGCLYRGPIETFGVSRLNGEVVMRPGDTGSRQQALAGLSQLTCPIPHPARATAATATASQSAATTPAAAPTQTVTYGLPVDIEKVKTALVVIGVVGFPGGGKTHWIGAVTDLLKAGALDHLGVSAVMAPGAMNPDVLVREVDGFFDSGGKPIVPTTPQAPNQSPESIILKVSIDAHGRTEDYFFVFFNASGENVTVLNHMTSPVGAFIQRADMIVYVAEPERLLNDYATSIRTDHAANIADVLMTRRRTRGDRTRDVSPFVLALSKSDLVRDHYKDRGVGLAFLEQGAASYSRSQLANRSADTKLFLEEHGGKPAVYQAVKGTPRGLLRLGPRPSTAFFAFSAMGGAPDPATGNFLGRPEPFLCLEPLVWGLYELGILREGPNGRRHG